MKGREEGLEVATRLDRGRVVETAMRVLDEVGLEGLTLRRIASELNVQAPALYWHFKNKQELLDEMATTMLRELMGPAEPGSAPPAGWEESLETMAVGLRRVLLRHRDGAKVFSGTQLTDATFYTSLEALLRVQVEAGAALGDAVCGFTTVYHYTVGFTIEEQAVHPMPGERAPGYGVEERAQRMDGGRTPLAQAAGEALFTKFDERFLRGLRLILRGIAQSLPHRS